MQMASSKCYSRILLGDVVALRLDLSSPNYSPNALEQLYFEDEINLCLQIFTLKNFEIVGTSLVVLQYILKSKTLYPCNGPILIPNPEAESHMWQLRFHTLIHTLA